MSTQRPLLATLPVTAFSVSQPTKLSVISESASISSSSSTVAKSSEVPILSSGFSVGLQTNQGASGSSSSPITNNVDSIHQTAPTMSSILLSSSSPSSSSSFIPSPSSSSIKPRPIEDTPEPGWSTTLPRDPPYSTSELTSTTSIQQQPTRSPPIHPHSAHTFKPDRLATLDLIIVVIYICLLLSTSISTMIRTKKSNKKAAQNAKGQTNRSAFLAGGRKMNWFTVGASIFASNLGSEHFIGLSGSAAANGISVAAFEMNALIILQVATWIFLPVLIVSKISTLPEYMQKRFGGKRIRTYLAVLSILLYIFTKISVNLYSGGIFIQQAIGWNLYTSAMFILALTSVMTLTGGLKGAMVIDNLQAFVMTIGASIVSAKALVAIGGWEGLKTRYMDAIPSKVPANLTHCAQPNPRAFQMLRPWNDRDMPWIGFIFGQTPASIWYWCADQMMVQRFLSARSLAHVQGSGVFAGYLKILSFLFMVIPGMISRCLYTDEVSCIDPDECLKHCQSSVSCSNTAYPRLVLQLMPLGARGMLVAAMVAALMNDLCNVFNSASALFSCDIWPLFRNRASPKEQETVGRVFVFVLVLASIMWIPVIQEMQGGQLFIYIQAVAALFAPPIAAVYCCAVLWKRTNETGAFWAMMIGFSLGILRLVLSFMYKDPSCGQTFDDRPWLLKHVHYMYYAAFLFVVAGGSAMLLSYLTKPPAPFRLIRTTFWTRFDSQLRKDDRNIYEMRYTGKRSNSRDSGGTSASLLTGRDESQSDLNNEASSSSLDPVLARSSSQLFTIEEKHECQTADLSSIIVDINNSDPKGEKKDGQKVTSIGSPKITGSSIKRPGLTHQASLSGAVGAASEAGKLIASKLATEVNLKGAKAKEIMLAAANHLTHPSSQIKFQNLRGDEEDDDEEDMNDADDYDEDDDEGRDSANLEGEDDEDDDEGSAAEMRIQRHKRNRRSVTQSAFSAALPYKLKQKLKVGYKKSVGFDELDDDECDESSNLKRSSSAEGRAQEETDDAGGSSTDEARNTPGSKLTRGSSKKLIDPTKNLSSSSSLSREQKRKLKRQHMMKLYDEPEEGGEIDSKMYKCLDNTVALLIKTRFEETLLRIAVGGIILVAIGIFVLFSLPPSQPDKQIIDMLVEKDV